MARRHKPRIDALSLELFRVCGKMANESTSAEDFIFMVQSTIFKKDVAAHFAKNFRFTDKGELLTDRQAANLFRVYCKLIYRYGSTLPKL